MPNLYGAQDDELKLASQSGAPQPAFALSEERKASPEYQQAQEGLKDFNERQARELTEGELRKNMPHASPEQIAQQLANFEQISSAGNMVGSLEDAGSGIIQNAIKAGTAGEGIEAAKAIPDKFGRIIQLIKERPAFQPKTVIPVGKIIRGR